MVSKHFAHYIAHVLGHCVSVCVCQCVCMYVCKQNEPERFMEQHARCICPAFNEYLYMLRKFYVYACVVAMFDVCVRVCMCVLEFDNPQQKKIELIPLAITQT